MPKTDYVKLFFFWSLGSLYRNYRNKNPSDMCIPILYICLFFFLVFCLKLNFSALLLCFVFICRRQRRCRRHIRTYERWYLLCRYVACFRFLPVPSRKVATHTHNRIPEEEKERHRNVQAHRHSTLTCIQYTTGTARSFCCSCRLSSGFIWSCSPSPLSFFVKLSLSPLPVPVALVLLSLYLTHFSWAQTGASLGDFFFGKLILKLKTIIKC